MINFSRVSKAISIMLILVVLVLNVSACNTVVTSGSTIEVKDQLQRTVKVPAKVNRIISSYTISTSLLIALGAKDKLVGIEIQAEERPLYRKAAPELLKLPAVGSGKTFNIEECLKLKPDLVILPYRMTEFVTKLEKLGIPVIAVAPENMDSFLETVHLIGKAAGSEQKAKELIDFYRQKIHTIEAAAKELQNKPVVYIAGSKSPLTTCTKEMYQHYLIELAGGENASQEIQKGYWANVSMEQVMKWNPEVICSVQYSTFKDQDLLKGEKWQSIKAVKDQKIYRFPSTLEPWDYPAPSAILGVLWLTNKLHPEVYTKEMFLKDARSFYKKFYRIDASDEELGA
ncbi:MAG: ABC transporter substrate-binding protein [Clostridia bacterium]|nr:ABC transporter substrate-binding protein [Clostridia bacterium]